MMLNGRELLWEERIRNNGREKGGGGKRGADMAGFTAIQVVCGWAGQQAQ